MSPAPSLLRTAALTAAALAVLVAAGPSASAQDSTSGGGPPPGSPPGPPANREAMWPAPTAEDWAKPCLIPFQRTWADALEVARERQRPILICVNMDGEIASEHYAGVRYRQPDIAKLYEPYVCVIASVYRHAPRDHDDDGNRILCPRFGSVTCGEHIAIEPPLYEKYFDGRRIAPRHVMVELDGQETYDVYFANDTDSVFASIVRGIEERPGGRPEPIVRGDRPVVERVASRDIVDRQAVEQAFASGDEALRKALLDAAQQHPEASPLQLLRLAIFGLDADLARRARQALAQTEDPAAADLIADALRVPMAPEEREALLAALDRLGSSSRPAQWLAVVHRGLSGESSAIDLAGWAAPAGGEYPEPARDDWFELDREREALSAASRAKPDDPAALADLAVASLALARQAPRSFGGDPKMARMFERHMYDDARRAALRAEELGSKDWRVPGVLAISAYYAGDPEEGYRRAEEAVKVLPPAEPSWNAMALLTIYAESRFKAIQQAIREKREWSPQWLTDLHAAYTALLRHPEATDAQVVWHYDFLVWLRARDRASAFLDEGLARFPGSAPLHERLRGRILFRSGPAGLISTYDALLAAGEPSAGLLRHAARAAVEAAEFHRRVGRVAEAEAAYSRALEHLDAVAAAEPDARGPADHAAALVHAGRARLALEAERLDAALADVVAGLERSPGSTGSTDALGFTPASTAQMLLERLRAAQRGADVERLEDALSKVDPALLVPNEPR